MRSGFIEPQSGQILAVVEGFIDKQQLAGEGYLSQRSTARKTSGDVEKGFRKDDFTQRSTSVKRPVNLNDAFRYFHRFKGGAVVKGVAEFDDSSEPFNFLQGGASVEAVLFNTRYASGKSDVRERGAVLETADDGADSLREDDTLQRGAVAEDIPEFIDIAPQRHGFQILAAVKAVFADFFDVSRHRHGSNVVIVDKAIFSYGSDFTSVDGTRKNQ